jgi:hypothetical protein
MTKNEALLFVVCDSQHRESSEQTRQRIFLPRMRALLWKEASSRWTACSESTSLRAEK